MNLVEMIISLLRAEDLTAYLDSPDSANPTVTVTPYMASPVAVDQAVIGDETRVQFFTRGLPNDYHNAYNYAWSVYNVMLAIYNNREKIGDYRSLEPIQAPSYLGIDEKKRHLFSFNIPFERID